MLTKYNKKRIYLIDQYDKIIQDIFVKKSIADVYLTGMNGLAQ